MVRRGSFLLASLLAALLVGCGGSGGGGSTSDPTPVTGATRASVRDAALSMGSVLREAGGRGAPSFSAPQVRGDLSVGDRIDIGAGLTGVVTAVEYGSPDGVPIVVSLDLDLFEDPDTGEKVGTKSTRLTVDGDVWTTTQEWNITAGQLAPTFRRLVEIQNRSTGARITDATGRYLRPDDDGELKQTEINVRWEDQGPDLPRRFSSSTLVAGIERHRFEGTYNADGSYVAKWRNRFNYVIEWRQNADRSGSFRVVNYADPLCPADGVYDAEGKGTVTFADGTTSDFDLYAPAFWKE